MPQNYKLDDLFIRTPSGWGLRGDPYLWQEMKIVLTGYPLPDSEVTLLHILEKVFEQITGMSIKEKQPIFVERFSHGGMSGGYVSAKFWVETAFPILLESYNQYREQV